MYVLSFMKCVCACVCVYWTFSLFLNSAVFYFVSLPVCLLMGEIKKMCYCVAMEMGKT